MPFVPPSPASRCAICKACPQRDGTTECHRAIVWVHVETLQPCPVGLTKILGSPTLSPTNKEVTGSSQACRRVSNCMAAMGEFLHSWGVKGIRLIYDYCD